MRGSPRRSFPLFLLVIALTAACSGAEAADDPVAFGDITVTGTPLPILAAGSDPAVGSAAPGLAGVGLDGSPVEFVPGTGPAVLLFLAHWCPHCQDEVPILTEWMQQNPDQGGVEIIAIATGTDPTQPNYPPGVWLEEEGYPGPVIFDDEDGTAANAYGINAFPFWVAVGSDGRVMLRTAGRLDASGMEHFLDAMANA